MLRKIYPCSTTWVLSSSVHLFMNCFYITTNLIFNHEVSEIRQCYWMDGRPQKLPVSTLVLQVKKSTPKVKVMKTFYPEYFKTNTIFCRFTKKISRGTQWHLLWLFLSTFLLDELALKSHSWAENWPLRKLRVNDFIPHNFV